MRDLSFQEALDDQNGGFQQFVDQCMTLWLEAKRAYEAQGSPFGPADEGSNVTRWVEMKLDTMDAIDAAEDLLGLG